MTLDLSRVRPIVRAALREDVGRGDVTSETLIPLPTRARAVIITQERGCLAGLPVATLAFTLFDRRLRCRLLVREGCCVPSGTPVLQIDGRLRSILGAERTAINLLGHLSGIATLTREFVRRVRGTRAIILDTRKTMPGLRCLEKYAVRQGGGVNHRAHLGEMVLIKSRHLDAIDTLQRRRVVRYHTISRELIRWAVGRARRRAPHHRVQIEVRNLRECEAALQAHPDLILLDNMSLAEIRRAVRLRRAAGARIPFEVSGRVTLQTVGAQARTGVERISVGALTHSARWMDFALRLREDV